MFTNVTWFGVYLDKELGWGRDGRALAMGSLIGFGCGLGTKWTLACDGVMEQDLCWGHLFPRPSDDGRGAGTVRNRCSR